MGRGRMYRYTWFNMPNLGYFLRIFYCGQDTSMSRLCTLRQLYFDHLHLWSQGTFPKCFFVKRAIVVPATKITSTYLPDQIPAVFQVIIANPALPSVLRKISHLGTLVHGKDRILAQGTETHSGNIQ